MMIDVHGAHVAVPGSLRRPGVAQQRVYDPGRVVEHPGSEVHFPPLANGLDYLLSVVEHLEAGTERVSARDLKYAVLHLAAGAEVLLKARLQLEHWVLVFKDPSKARRSELESGSLSSCTPSEAVQRLQDIAQVVISPKNAAALDKLAKHRNALTHYGLTGPSANARAVESQAAEVLDFLISFLDEELFPRLSDDERDGLEAEMERIRGGLRQIKAFVRKRLQRLKNELAPLAERTTECPACGNWTFVAGEEGRNGARAAICRFCGQDHLSFAAAQIYGWEVLGRNPFDADIPSPEGCPRCGDQCLVSGARTAAASSTPVDFCFRCATVVTGLPPYETCPLCSGAWRRYDPKQRACDNCLHVDYGTF
ncbi:hypothetical protein [Streptomyces sp. A1547]|uniref:hypothetical protein n=1 Tax=Streptomyces sp. A1547 TaxID=2563105 RepID=UPI00109EBC64|nr:hypothetical protein [Streptomyces sp. A1547]THA33730.1 hypothetical protein E6W17_31040 [Streptomyces sp. A1547]